MSCNGCRVLRKGCSETCVLRSCLQWIDSPEAQGHATLFLAKFFGRSDLISFVSSVPDHQRPALFQSLLFEACGRTVNPVNGAVGLLSSGNWRVCQTAVETVLAGRVLSPMQGILAPTMARPQAQDVDESASLPIPNRRQYYYPSSSFPKQNDQTTFNASSVAASAVASASAMEGLKREHHTISLSSEDSVTTTSSGIGDRKERKLLNLFV